MSLLHDASVGSYLQILEGTAGVMALGRTYAEENDLDLQEVVMTRLRGHAALPLPCFDGAPRVGRDPGIQKGEFSLPPSSSIRTTPGCRR